jgi:hypothetical protein
VSLARERTHDFGPAAAAAATPLTLGGAFTPPTFVSLNVLAGKPKGSLTAGETKSRDHRRRTVRPARKPYYIEEERTPGTARPL